MQECGSNTRSPLLDPANYGYWKARMQSFISAIDGAWHLVETEWQAPTLSNGDLKPSNTWTPAENTAFSLNHRALTAIYNGVDPTEFKRISTCKTAFQAGTYSKPPMKELMQ